MAGTPFSKYVQQDFQNVPVKNLNVEPIAGSVTPSALNVGRIYLNTSTTPPQLEFVTSSTTVVHFTVSGSIVDGDISAGAAIQLSKLATNPLARANHTGTQLAATISDFDTQVNTHRLDQFQAPTSALNHGGQRASNAADPTAVTDLTTMQWVQNAIAAVVNGHDWKDAVRVAVTANVTVSNPGTATFDGVAYNAGDRILLAGQTTASENGIYVFNGSGVALTRSTDANTSASVTSGESIPITAGSHAAQIAILTTADPITLGTTSLTYTFLTTGGTYVAGTGITISGNTISLTSPVSVALGGTGATTAAQARTNLGVGQIGKALAIPALTAGTEVSLTHSLNTLNATLQAFRISDGANVEIGLRRIDANTAGVTADVAVPTGTLTLLVNPIA